MQSPTPPTKPTPPTPPSMKTSTRISSTDTSSPTTTVPQSIISSKETPPTSITKEPSTPSVTTPAPEAVTNLPPLGGVSASPDTTKETTSETGIPATTNAAKSASTPRVFSTFFVLILILGITLIAVHWWKNYKPKQRSIIDYSTESSDEMVNLIFSDQSPESATQMTPKKIVKKIPQPTDSTPKTKSNFEVRA